MNTQLDLHDIQGTLLKPYVRYGLLKGRYVLFRITHDHAGRKLLGALLPLITDGSSWDGPNAQRIPAVTTNVAFTYEGLKHLGLPEQSLHSFPPEFSMGMKARREFLGDDGPSDPACWDPVWGNDTNEQPVHILIIINGRSVSEIETRYGQIVELAGQSGGVEQLSGHSDANGQDAPFQEASVLMDNGQPIAKEHFGYTDGISETFFRGMTNPANLIGGGKPAGFDADPASPDGWLPLEPGEFLLGHKDEAFEYPEAPIPRLLALNGTFFAYRKLHQNVGTFHRFVAEMGKRYPGGPEELSAKFVGRWKNGAPLATFPTKAEADAFGAKLERATREFHQADPAAKPQAKARLEALQIQLVGFNYQQDISGAGCPLGAHIRRINPRGALDFGRDAFNTYGALVNRRRIIRRGLPYGEVTDPDRDDGNHGIVIMVHNSSLRRQFEFVQQQWLNFGNDFKLGNDKDPLLGNHNQDGRLTIQADPKGSKPPFFCGRIPRFVETRGGDYFFAPSITALNLIAKGLIDPT